MSDTVNAKFDLNPTDGLDISRLKNEMNSYQQWMDEKTDDAYRIAEIARGKNLDYKPFVEIPRAADLAGRTEKLLVEYLGEYEVADDIRKMLAKHDRETTSMLMAQSVARGFRDQGHDLVTAIDVGLRVGLAILTEAVLVAPLEGISEVRLLNNLDGSQFVSVHFAGPIRAAGGTAQALAVLIADMIRIELNVGRYQPTDPEVERVKEEFGLYRGNLQYRPSPEEIDEIVRACPVMINGESTERIECAGYGNVRNIDEARIRGGVLLVIGEGMCLKAPKIRKHTERMKISGWDFITKFAEKDKKDDDSEKVKFKSRLIEPITKFMNDIIAGRPVFGAPQEPGGFRLRYGRSRPSGLAAASVNPACMLAMDDFITIGTQMKIERPGKACAITPSSNTDGPWVVLRDGGFTRCDTIESFNEVKDDIGAIWDNGEIVIGYGEFMENNKNLVPAGYSMDWWASDLIEELSSPELVANFCSIMSLERKECPTGVPGLSKEQFPDADLRFNVRRQWHKFLVTQQPNWLQAKEIVEKFKTSLPPSHNPWFLDLPIEWVPEFIELLKQATVENLEADPNQNLMPKREEKCLRIKDGVVNWKSTIMLEMSPTEISVDDIKETPGPSFSVNDFIFDHKLSALWTLQQHGLAKGSALLLGLAHHHDGDDLVITSGWSAMMEAFGFSIDDDKPIMIVDSKKMFEDRIAKLKLAETVLAKEESRLEELEKVRAIQRISAETNARQLGKSIAETDEIGRIAAANIPDEGPKDANKFLAAQIDRDDHRVDGILPIIKKISKLRWHHSAPVRIGCRMGRPEKSAPRIMNPMAHTLFPIELNGGNQRLLANAADKKDIRIQLGLRTCIKCGKKSPMLSCHHRKIDGYGGTIVGEKCGGRTEFKKELETNRRRRGEITTVPIASMIEDAMINLGLERLPNSIKCMKKIASKNQTPEALEKGILRAKYDIPVFRDGTVRFDMSDVPVTHFKPNEIGVSWKRLVNLGYTHDYLGNELTSDDQMLELYPQDFIVAKNAADYFVRTAQFVDELLTRYYGLEPYYNVSGAEDLVGHLICALAPHTSGGVLSRIIGWADCSGGYAHPLFHASKRRNCDGDEDAIMLLMDGLLNFSREILPANRGGQMDAPLVLTTRLNPTEVDKEALNVDSGWYYERDFYEATQDCPHPKTIANRVDFVERRLGSVAAVRGYGFTHDCESISAGPALSAYKTLDTMIDKMNGQLDLGHILRAVDVRKVASSVIRSHFLPDLRGNLNAFARQKVRCLKCGHSYRRMPISGKCIQISKASNAGFGSLGITKSTGDLCNGNLALTVSEGAVRKYIKVTLHVMEKYGVDTYTKQNVEWLANSTDSLFQNDRARQMSLSDFL